MKLASIFLTLVIGVPAVTVKTGTEKTPGQVTPSIVDFDAFEKLTSEVKIYRKDRLVNLDEFLKMSKEANTVILDTRSDALYARKHIKGAIHLDFTDFTQANLASILPSNTTRILIYCNNNFIGDQNNFATKSFSPPAEDIGDQKPVSLALNIPTFINLYGYGYQNVYELGELVTIGKMLPGDKNERVEFEGTAVPVYRKLKGK